MLNKNKLAYYVIEEIKQMLIDGRLKEGEKLPNQNDFAEQLGVSRLSLREALHTLQLLGVIRQKPKTGTIITVGDPDKWIKPVTPPMLDDEKSIMELLEARKIVESTIAAVAAKNITDEEIEKLKKIMEETEEIFSKKDLQKYKELDAEFHLLIVNASNNRYLVNMYMIVYNLAKQFMVEAYEVMPGLLMEALKMHKLIFVAISERDEQKAAKAAMNHIALIEKQFKSYYQMCD